MSRSAYRRRKYSFYMWLNVVVFSVIIIPSCVGVYAQMAESLTYPFLPVIEGSMVHPLVLYKLNFYFEILSIVSFLMAMYNVSYIKVFLMPSRKNACRALAFLSVGLCVFSVVLKFV